MITATNQDLKNKISENKFRRDLYYRLNVITIELPPLRERKEDIEPLVAFFVNKVSRTYSKEIKGISKEALRKLSRYEWPGNVRELENVIERAVVLCRSNIIETVDMPLEVETQEPKYDTEKLSSMERKHIKTVLEKTGWNLSETAKRLGIHRNTLRLKMKEYGIEKD